MNPIDFAYFKPHTHTHTHTHCHICYANSDAAAERELCGESELMLMRSCSCSLTKMQLIHEWRRLRLPHFTPLPRWQRSSSCRLPCTLRNNREQESKQTRERARRGLVAGKTRASLAATATLLLLLWLWIIHSFLQALKIALASLVREKAARATTTATTNIT